MTIGSETLINGEPRATRAISPAARRWLRGLIILGLCLFGFFWLVDGFFTALRAGPIFGGIASFFVQRLYGSPSVHPAFVWGAGWAVHLLFSFGQYHLWRLRVRFLIGLGFLFAGLNIITSTLGVRDILISNRVELSVAQMYAAIIGGGFASALLPEPAITALMIAWKKL